MTRALTYIAVVGGHPAREQDLEAAREVGRALAREGAALVCGGLGGVMEAACRGAKEESGLTVGILPGDDRSDANEQVDVAIATGMGEMRNALIVRSVDAVIAIGGGFGTLSEIAFALKTGTPVVGLATWDLSKPDGGEMPIQQATSPQEAVARALTPTRDARSPRPTSDA